MKTGTVMGALETSKAARGYEQARWVQLRTQTGTAVAIDPIGVAAGDTVIFTEGPTAEHYDLHHQSDAVIIAVVK